MVEHHSHKIQNIIQKELFNAKQSIKIVVAWFTNDLLFQPLVLKQKVGVNVEIILNKDEINCSEENSIDFNDLENAGGTVRWNDTKQLMHDKFCIIDDDIVIYGSYNWTNKAEYNEESITISRNETKTSQFFLDKFRGLSDKYHAGQDLNCHLNPSKQNITQTNNTPPNSLNTQIKPIDINSLSIERSKKPYIKRLCCPLSFSVNPSLRFFQEIDVISMGYSPKRKTNEDVIIAKCNGSFYFLDPNTFLPFNNVEFSEYKKWHNNAKGGILWLKTDGKWGLYEDREKRFIFQPVCDDIEPFQGEYTAIKFNGKWGLVDVNGNITLDCRYDSISYTGKTYLYIKFNGRSGKFEKGKVLF